MNYICTNTICTNGDGSTPGWMVAAILAIPVVLVVLDFLR